MEAERPKRMWKVTVLCEGYASAIDDAEKLSRAYVRMLIEARDGCDAMRAGRELAMSAPLPLDVRWKSFEATEASVVAMPLFIDEL
jgi:hypothetical protein